RAGRTHWLVGRNGLPPARTSGMAARRRHPGHLRDDARPAGQRPRHPDVGAAGALSPSRSKPILLAHGRSAFLLSIDSTKFQSARVGLTPLQSHDDEWSLAEAQ